GIGAERCPGWSGRAIRAAGRRVRQLRQRARAGRQGAQGGRACLHRDGADRAGRAHAGAGRALRQSRGCRPGACEAQVGRCRVRGGSAVAMSASVAALTGWDYFVIATLLISIALGLLRGLVRTVFALAAWVVALVGAPLATGPLLAATGWSLHPVFVAVLVFFALLVSVRLLGALIARALAKVGLGLADRSLGAVLGVVRALIVVTIVALVARHLGADRDPAWQQALSRPLLDELVSWVTPYLPARSETVKQT